MVGNEFWMSLAPVTTIDRWLRLNRCNILQGTLRSYGVRRIPMNFVVVIRLGLCEVFFHWKRWESEKFLQSMIGFLSDSSRWKTCGIHVRGNVGVVLVCHCRIPVIVWWQFPLHCQLSDCIGFCLHASKSVSVIRVPTIIRSFSEYIWQVPTGFRSCLVGAHRILL